MARFWEKELGKNKHWTLMCVIVCVFECRERECVFVLTKWKRERAGGSISSTSYEHLLHQILLAKREEGNYGLKVECKF